MDASEHASPVFIRVISEIRGLYTVNFELHTACRDFRVGLHQTTFPFTAQPNFLL